MVLRWTPWSTAFCTKLEPMLTLNHYVTSRSPAGMFPSSYSKLQAMPSSLVSGAAAAAAANSGRVNPQVLRIPALDLLPTSRGLIARRCRASCGNEGSESRLEGSSEDEFLSGVLRKSASGSNLVPDMTAIELALFNKQGAMGALAVMMLLGLQMCPEAWAGAEVAKINVNPGLLDFGDWSDIQSGFAGAFLLIFFSEIGDKTFFIAALLATRKSSVAVFSGTFGALMAMTVISVCLGRVFHYIDGVLPSFGDTKLPVDDIAAVILLIYFGVSTLIDAASMEDSDSGEEKQEAELAIANVGAGGAVAGTVAATFALVFVAEWGDKSFFSTIALAAASSPLGVVSGAIAGHGAATLLAVLGGSFLGNYVSEKVIAYVGGVLFLVFAGATLVEILN